MRALWALGAVTLWFGGVVPVAAADDGLSSLASSVPIAAATNGAGAPSAATAAPPDAASVTTQVTEAAVGATTSAAASAASQVATTVTTPVTQVQATAETTTSTVTSAVAPSPALTPVNEAADGVVSLASGTAAELATRPVLEEVEQVVATVAPVVDGLATEADRIVAPAVKITGPVTTSVTKVLGESRFDGTPTTSPPVKPTTSAEPPVRDGAVATGTTGPWQPGLPPEVSAPGQLPAPMVPSAPAPTATQNGAVAGCGALASTACAGAIGLQPDHGGGFDITPVTTESTPTPARVTVTGAGAFKPPSPEPTGSLLRGAIGPAAAAATGGSSSGLLFAAIAASLSLATPRLGRRLRPSSAPWPLPLPQLSFERPG